MVCLVLDCFFVVCDVHFDVSFTLSESLYTRTQLLPTQFLKRDIISSLFPFDAFNVVANVHPFYSLPPPLFNL